MIITYLAAPLTPTSDESVAINLMAAKKWYGFLSKHLHERVFMADWILHCEIFAGDRDDDKELRAIGMLRNFKLIDVCHELVLVGPRVSNGMRAEMDYAGKRGLRVLNLVGATMNDFDLAERMR
jgi:hypothetical protein